MTLSGMVDKPPRRRRTRAEMDLIRDAMASFAEEHKPVTVRQLFYVLVSASVVEKSEREYKSTVIRLALGLRRSGRIPWENITDATRWYYKPRTHDSLADALEECARLYRRSLWTDLPIRVQVWCESLSVAGIVRDVAEEWDVPLYPGKGYTSHDFVRSAARDIAFAGKPAVVYLLGDYDASGRDIIRFASKSLREYAAEVDSSVPIDFRTIAVTEAQIVEWSLPSHPAKKKDSRFKRYGIRNAVELEAIPPDRLRELVRGHIVGHLDPEAVYRLETIEAAERETLRAIAKGGGRR